MENPDPRPEGSAPAANSKQSEARLLVFILVVLFPVVTIMLVGAVGLAVWIWQTFTVAPFPG